jgi:hypothetical protein
MDPLIEIKYKDGTSSWCRASLILRITPDKKVITSVDTTYNGVVNIDEIVRKVNLC